MDTPRRLHPSLFRELTLERVVHLRASLPLDGKPCSDQPSDEVELVLRASYEGVHGYGRFDAVIRRSLDTRGGGKVGDPGLSLAHAGGFSRPQWEEFKRRIDALFDEATKSDVREEAT